MTDRTLPDGSSGDHQDVSAAGGRTRGKTGTISVHGWDIVVGAVTITLGLVCLANVPGLDRAIVPLLVFVSWYAAVGHRALVTRGTAWSIAYVGGCALVLAVGVALNPWLGPLQALVIAIVWWLFLPNRLRSVVGTVVVCAAAAVGSVLFATWVDPGVWPQRQFLVYVVVLPAATVMIAVVAGFWADRLFRWGSDRGSLVQDLRWAEERRVTLEREAATAQERLRLSREIHDTIAQDIAGLRLLVEQARREIDGPDAPPAAVGSSSVRRTLDLIDQAADAAFVETRNLVAQSSPALPGPTLGASIERIVGRFSRETGIVVETELADVRLVRAAEVVVVRCVQEGLANARRHAQAARVWLRLQEGPDGCLLTLDDDGVGMVPEAVPGFGLAGMADRVNDAGGILAVESPGPYGGVGLRIRLPREALCGAVASSNDDGRISPR